MGKISSGKERIIIRNNNRNHGETLTLTISGLTSEGAGISRTEIGVVFVHGALPGEPVDLVKAVPRQHVPSRHADDESPVVLYESPVKRGPVAAPVVDEGALASGRGHDRGDELEDLVVLPEMPRGSR